MDFVRINYGKYKKFYKYGIFVLSFIAFFFAFCFYANQRFNEGEADYFQTKKNIYQTYSALLKFKKVCGRFPTKDEGLDSLRFQHACGYIPNDGFIDRKFINGYGTPLEYEVMDNKFKLTSVGKNSVFIYTNDGFVIEGR